LATGAAGVGAGVTAGLVAAGLVAAGLAAAGAAGFGAGATAEFDSFARSPDFFGCERQSCIKYIRCD